MKIGFVCSNYLPFTGGVEIHARQVSQALSKRHNVIITAMNFASSRLPRRLAMLNNCLLAPSASDRMDGAVQIRSLSPSFVERITLLPLALRAMPRLQRWFYHQVNRLTHPFYAAVMVPKIARHLRGSEVIHGLVHGDIGWAAEKAARLIGAAFVCTPFVHPRQWGDGPNDREFYRRADAVIGLVQSDRDYLEQIGVPAGKLHVIGVSPDLPTSPDAAGFRKKYGLGDAPVILYVGRMMRQKGAFAIVEASRYIWETHSEARFLFIGPANDEELTIFAGCDPRINYVGKVSTQEKVDALAACDIFCMPSTSEILPTVYLEAWSLGKPVIGGTAHGLRELVEGNRAGVCSEQAPVELASALTRMLNDARLRSEYGANGRDLVARRYSVEAVVGQLEELYISVAANRTKSFTGLALSA